MKEKQDPYDVGVIVGRFQVHELHDAHRELIDHVCDEHEKVVIFLGLSPLMVSTNNPLDFEARKQMIQEAFPNVNVLYLKDQSSDDVWSSKLDEMVDDLRTPTQSIVLYGGRDSFIRHYSGVYPTKELVQSTFMAGKAVRREISRSRTKATPDFRAGVIWASQARFPTVYTTVDVAVFNEDRTQVLLGRKPGEVGYRLIGGFSDPASKTFEQDAKREVGEETGIEIGDLTYVGSSNVNDWRYRNEPDGIRTLVFTAKYLFGHPEPNDDIEEVRWFDFDVRQPFGGIDEPIHTPHQGLLELIRSKEAKR